MKMSNYVLGTLLPVGPVVTGAIAAVNHGAVRVYWILGTIAATLLVSAFGVYKSVRADAASERTVTDGIRLRTAVAEAGQAVVVNLGEVSSAKTVSEKESACFRLVQTVVKVAREQCGSNPEKKSSRAVFYYRTADRLERRWYDGRRHEAPRRDIVSSRSEHEREMVGLANGENSLLVRDLLTDPPPHFVDPAGRPYRTFIAVPVRAGDVSFGLLIVDSPVANSFSDIDVGFMILLAGALGAGLAQQASDHGFGEGTAT
jgi:GAF domain-containing protein